MDEQTRNVQNLIADLRECGYVAVQKGTANRWHVTDPINGGKGSFVPNVLATRNLPAQVALLKKELGFDPAKAEAIRAANHKTRLDKDRSSAAAAIERAENDIKTRAAEEAAAQQVAAELAAEQARQEVAPMTTVLTKQPVTLEQIAAQLAEEAITVGSVRFEEIDLDEQFARDLLKHNREFKNHDRLPGETTNRVTAPDNQLDAWAKSMVNGHWVLIPHGIALDWDGFLLDGQNRLKALIRANEKWQEFLDPKLPDYQERMTRIAQDGVSVPMMISYDWDPQVFDRIDRGRPRTLTDLLSITGEVDRNNLGTAARMLYQFDHDMLGPTQRKLPIPEHYLLEYIAQNQPAINEAILEARGVNNGTTLLVAAAAAGIFACRRVWPITDGTGSFPGDVVGEFIEGLRHGYTETEHGRLPLPERDPRLALRGYLVSPTGRKDRNRHRHMALFIKTFNKWVTGGSAQLVKFGPAENFPQPVGRG